jgi:hypothetical protein
MNVARRSQTILAAGQHRWRGTRGVALIEVALVLLIVVFGIGLGLTLTKRVVHRQDCDNYIRDLRVFSTAFANHFQQHKMWPPGSCADVLLPAELTETLRDTNWFKGSPVGGKYGWVAPVPADSAGPGREWGGRGAVTLTAFSPDFPLTLDRSDLLYIDSQIDDGNLSTGRFRTGFNGWPVYLVEAPTR